jgi:hypothetical protein
MDTRDARVVIETTRHRIIGTLHLPRDGYRSRVTDFLNGTERDFVALTDVELTRLDGSEPVRRYSFVAVGRTQIVLAREADETLGDRAPRR